MLAAAPDLTDNNKGNSSPTKSVLFLQNIFDTSSPITSTASKINSSNPPLNISFPLSRYSLHVFTLSVAPGGTLNPRFVIAASPAPFPPKIDFIVASPSHRDLVNKYTFCFLTSALSFRISSPVFSLTSPLFASEYPTDANTFRPIERNIRGRISFLLSDLCVRVVKCREKEDDDAQQSDIICEALRVFFIQDTNVQPNPSKHERTIVPSKRARE